MRLEHVGWRVLKAGGIVAFSILLGSCGGLTSRQPETNPQVYKLGDRVPEGGGVRKVGNAYQIKGRWYQPKATAMAREVGMASWYGEYFHGRKTANGEWYDMERLSAAHPTMPLPSYVRVTNLENRRSVVVRVNDRGPYASDRVIDMSHAAAVELGFVRQGTARVAVQYIGEAPLNGDVRDMQFVDGGANARRRLTNSPQRRGPPNWTASIAEPKTAGAVKAVSGGPKSSPLADRLLTSGPLPERRPATTASLPAPAKAGGKPRLITPAAALSAAPAGPRPPKIIPMPAAKDGRGFFVQAASFNKLERARSLREDLADLGIFDILPVEIGTSTFYRVRLGPFDDEEDARRARQAVAARGHDDARIFAR